MAKQRICPPCGSVLTAETEDELVAAVQEHARNEHGAEVERQHILDEATDVDTAAGAAS
jgi:predicted small metal-binding protein